MLRRHLSVGEPEHPVPLRDEFCVTGPVGFEGVAATVELVAVDLDDQPALVPQEVDEETAHPDIHSRCWNPVAAAEA